VKIHDYLRQNIEKYPDGLFLVSGEESYSYSQFYEMVNRFASSCNCNILIKCRGNQIEGIHEFGAILSHNDGKREEAEVNENDTSFIIYTPGTTGKPLYEDPVPLDFL